MEHICTSFHGLLATSRAIWAYGGSECALAQHFGLGFHRCPAQGCEMPPACCCVPQLQKLPTTSKAAEIPVCAPRLFVFLGSLCLTNLLLCLLEIGDTFLMKWEALCLMELSEKVRAGAFLEQTSLTLHHNLQAEMNHGLQIAVGTVTRAICIRPSLNNHLRAHECKGGLALTSFDCRSARRKKIIKHLHEQNSLSSSAELLLSFVFNNMVFAHSQTAVCKVVQIQG